ncbi:tRNA1(Val) (adenine(37)-N6)-methyltransferase [Alteromonas sp. CYL-A6]|uniref:tRNA1(Val) (adenine(37)-N6)-methyltransferase n=1 Tax=Alteromonas nitratireducens TaxID=3390813 RepID=UPI0034B4727F
MKVGTDSLILGSWVQTDGHQRMLDVGTGCGLLALMLAQRSALTAHIDAVEIDVDAARQATENVRQSPWPEKISIIPGAVQDFQYTKPYSLIVSNPPYFTHSAKATRAYEQQSPARHTARQQAGLSPSALFAFARQALTRDGELVCLYPTDSRQHIIEAAGANGLALSSSLSVSHRADCVPYVTVFHFSHNASDVSEHSLFVRDLDGQYSAAFRQLCQPFYLNF